MLVRMYFDESGTHEGSEAQCIAGYAIREADAELMMVEWQAVLDKYELPFFHMKDCAARQKQFRKYRDAGDTVTPDLIVAELIQIIKQRVIFGLAVLFNPAVFKATPDPILAFEDVYSDSVKHSAVLASSAASHEEGVDQVHLTYEAGHASQKLAMKTLQKLVDDQDSAGRNKQLKITGVSFETDKQCILLQAADLLAWHATKYVKCWLEGRNIRADFKSLVGVETCFYHMMNVWHASGERVGIDVYLGHPMLNLPGWRGVIQKMYAENADFVFDLRDIRGERMGRPPPIVRWTPIGL